MVILTDLQRDKRVMEEFEIVSQGVGVVGWLVWRWCCMEEERRGEGVERQRRVEGGVEDLSKS